MRPFSNKFNVLLLIIAIGLLVYFLIDLATILSGVAIISGPIYPLYLSIGILVFIIISLVVLILWRIGKDKRPSEMRV
jgi:membrane protein implicated in regulation of membrane protease activity